MFLLVVLCAVLCTVTEGMRVNLTMFSNCRDVKLQYEEMPISLVSVRYDRDGDGVCNTLHAEYEVKKTSEEVGWELIITSYNCDLQNSVICLDNPKEYIEPMHCDRFHSDDSGPWFMIADAMTNGDRCGRETGRFNLDAAVLKIKYLEQYLAMGKGTYRVRMLFHIPGTDLETLNMRGCCEMDFDIID
uniref:Antennae-specific protein n=1 Tax=Anopheles atroparvus TaxID=41427 RepID=A0A182JGG7_ANOAO